jgi:iduronate 2-sulfatase
MKYFSILVFALVVFTLTASAQKQEKPNILFIISDDLSATAVSSYENKACHTPNIDGLASEGVNFC